MEREVVMTKSEILQVAKPILYNTEMVRAILDGRKTMTRRLIKPQPQTGAVVEYNENKGIYWSWWMDGDKHFAPKDGIKKPPYNPGQYLYVRETWYLTDCLGLQNGYIYKASVDERQLRILEKTTGIIPKWRPSIHMPKEVARIFLKVTDVRAERLQEITLDQIYKEGVQTEYPYQLNGEEKIYAFRNIWDSTIKKQDLKEYGWDGNPWVFVISFDRMEVK